jgi:hypothetical protein
LDIIAGLAMMEKLICGHRNMQQRWITWLWAIIGVMVLSGLAVVPAQALDYPRMSLKQGWWAVPTLQQIKAFGDRQGLIAA